LNREGSAFHNAIKKHGDGLTWSVIDTADNLEELNRKEMFWIEFHKSYIHNECSEGYNLTRGGDGSVGFRHSKETCSKLRSNHLGTKASDETRLKMSVTRKGKTNGHLGFTASDETRRRMSESRTGERNPNYGKRHSDETRAKMRESAKRDWAKRKSVVDPTHTEVLV
jgi:group I intron endonuclease